MQFPAGLTSLVEECLAQDLSAVEIEQRDESSVVFASRSAPGAVADLRYIKNGFQVLLDMPRRSLADGLNRFSGAVEGRSNALSSVGRAKPFRLMAHIDGELAGLPKPGRQRLERAIAARTGGRVQPRGMGEEFWIVGRRDYARLLFGWRIPKPRRETPPDPGGLSAELSHLLVRLSRPVPDDRFLDPFAGSGALVTARAAYPAVGITFSDLAEPSPGGRGAPRVRYLREDALTLPSVADGAIGVIVTDPPWGEYAELEMDYGAFLDQMWRSFARVLDPAVGRIVILVARRLAQDTVSAAREVGFVVAALHDILVNGHPSSAIMFRCDRA